MQRERRQPRVKSESLGVCLSTLRFTDVAGDNFGVCAALPEYIYIFSSLSHVKRERERKKGMDSSSNVMLCFFPLLSSFFLAFSLSCVCLSLVSARCFVPVVCVSCLKREEGEAKKEEVRRADSASACHTHSQLFSTAHRR